MIIPVRCMTCGKILADKWNAYIKMIKEDKKGQPFTDRVRLLDISKDNIVETSEAKALNKLELKRYCCRRHMLTNVNLIDII